MKAVRGALIALAIPAIAVAVLTAILFANRQSLIYPFPVAFDARAPWGFEGATLHEVVAADGARLVVWARPPRPGRPVAIFFTGNGAYLPGDVPRFAQYAEAGIGVVAPVYRGAGGTAGTPSEAALIGDALAVFDALPRIAPGGSGVVVHGWSLGGAVAVALAAERPAAGLVVEATFARLCEIPEEQYVVVPACRIMRSDTWESAVRIARGEVPVLMLHGAEDRVVTIGHGEALRDAAEAAGRSVDWQVVPGAGHAIPAGAAMRRILDWVEGLRFRHSG